MKLFIMSLFLVSRQSTNGFLVHYTNLASFRARGLFRNTFALTSSELDDITNEIIKLNGGKSINVNSHKQVSQAIFGCVHRSTSRKSLLEASSSDSLDQQKRTLATLVLRYRNVQSTGFKRDLSTRLATAEMFNDEDTDDDDVLSENVSPVARKHVLEFPFEQTVEQIFGKKSKVHPYWKDQLLRINKPSARYMVNQLNGDICPMGYDPLAVPHDPLRVTVDSTVTAAGKRGSLLAYVRDEKLRFQECVMLVRVGEFYESFGIDAIMLVEHCGLNPMAGKCRAGCPVRNIQATLDCLTEQGLKVAVYEEAVDTDAVRGPSTKARLKTRMLGQVVSSASPSYLYDLVLLGNSDMLASFQESRPYVGVIGTAAGYTMVEITMEDKSVKVSERLTPEAVSCRLRAYPPVDPLLYVGDEKTRSLPFLSSSCASQIRVKTIPSYLVEGPSSSTSDVERAKRIVVRALIGMVDDMEACKLSEEDFTLAYAKPNHDGDGIRTNPLYFETATQLGLMGDKNIPSLISSLLPDSAPVACRRFLRRWLLTPPPPSVSNAMANLVANLRQGDQPLPVLSVPPVGKIVALLRAGQASAPVYGEILSVLNSTLKTIFSSSWIDPMMTLLEFESGIAADPESINARCSEAVRVIEEVVSSHHHATKTYEHNDILSDFGALIPQGFFERNELLWRGRVRPEVCKDAYDRVELAASNLARAVAADFWGVELMHVDQFIREGQASKSPIVQDVVNNQFALKDIPTHGKADSYFHPRDRNGKMLRNRYTTAAVQSALSEYVAASDEACQNVASVLTSLSEKLCDEGHLPAIVQAAHFNLIMATASQHSAKSNALGWSMAQVVQRQSQFGEGAGRFRNVWPYWMDKNSAISNTFDLDGMFLLTAPNMSGKSTVMRATAAAALLSSCGLCAPLESSSVIRRFDNIFVRGASADIPSENLSAFGAEVLDIAALLRCCTLNSLVFVDELGRGTSPRDGTGIAAAVVEAMAQRGMSGFFATHLHEIFDLPLRDAGRVRNKRMTLSRGDDGNELSTYLLEDGICTDSLAMVTAARFGFPDTILERARTFSNILTKDNSPVKVNMDLPPLSMEPSESETKTLDDAVRAISSISGCDGTPVMIPPKWNPPPSLEGSSCLYVLELQGEDSKCFYVGETDSLSQRLAQHRAKGGAWSNASIAAFRVKEGKSQARHFECLAIRELAARGFNMVSIVDGRRKAKPY